MLVVLACGRLRQEDYHKSETSMSYMMSSRLDCATKWEPISKSNKSSPVQTKPNEMKPFPGMSALNLL